MWVRGCPINSACLTLQTSRNPGSSSGGGPWWLRAATKVLPPRQPRAGARRPPPGEYKSKKISKECWTRQSLSFQICGYRHNWVLLKDVRNMQFYFGQWNSFNVLSLSWFHRPEGFFQCLFIVMASQGFNVFSLSWFPRAVGFFECLFIVMASQGSGVLSRSVIMVSQGNGILKAVGFFISMSFHCHGFTGQWDSEGSGILYFDVLSLSWFHRAMGFCGQRGSLFQCLFIVMVSQGTWIHSMSCHCHYTKGATNARTVEIPWKSDPKLFTRPITNAAQIENTIEICLQALHQTRHKCCTS